MQGGDEGVRRAILFAVGNTVVSDTLDAARVLCSGQDGKKARRKEKYGTRQDKTREEKPKKRKGKESSKQIAKSASYYMAGSD